MITIDITPIDVLLHSARWAFSTRRVHQPDAVKLTTQFDRAKSGDLVLAKVLDIGSHKRIQLPSGRPSELYPGDLIVASCGARYASDQFEGIASLKESSDLLAGGGCIGVMRKRHNNKKHPTRVKPLGLLTDINDRILNLEQYALKRETLTHAPRCIAVVGASMNSGKTTAAAAIIRGLARAGHQVAALKVTGTGAFGDYNAYTDAGASFVADFTDAGMVSTYQQPVSRIETGIRRLVSASVEQNCSVAVVEFADGVLQHETAALLANNEITKLFESFIYATGDSLSALGGYIQLATLGIQPAVLTGMISASPLSSIEATQATGIPVLTREQLSDPIYANSLMYTKHTTTKDTVLAA